MKLEILQKIFGYTSKVRKFLEDFGEHLRPGEKKEPFLVSSYFRPTVNYSNVHIRALKSYSQKQQAKSLCFRHIQFSNSIDTS